MVEQQKQTLPYFMGYKTTKFGKIYRGNIWIGTKVNIENEFLIIPNNTTLVLKYSKGSIAKDERNVLFLSYFKIEND